MDFISIAQNLGVAVACLVALGYGVWKISNIVVHKIGVPLVDSHMAFLQDMREQVGEHTKTLVKVSETMDKICLRLDDGLCEYGKREIAEERRKAVK